jgi:hypothetical protein
MRKIVTSVSSIFLLLCPLFYFFVSFFPPSPLSSPLGFEVQLLGSSSSNETLGYEVQASLSTSDLGLRSDVLATSDYTSSQISFQPPLPPGT